MKENKFVLLILYAILSLLINEIESKVYTEIVSTKNGKIRGVVKELDDGKIVNVYYGIPYGKPPIGKQRFRKPEPTSNWVDVYNATKIGNACMQQNTYKIKTTIKALHSHWIWIFRNGFTEGIIPVSEDCLYLTVWQPSSNSSWKRPVMFFIHGGTFKLGSMFSLAYDARYLAGLGDVIVVTINYRLGAFGFLYADPIESPGNLGIHDQILALKWVNDNIEAFGGDKSAITIFGHSAGSMSIGAIVLSPLASGLFKRAILQSGAPNSYLGSELKDTALSTAKGLATSLSCNQSTIINMINCIREKPVDSILNFSKKSTINGQTFQPIFGDEVMPIKPSIALKNGNFNKNIDIIFGTVRDEGSIFIKGITSLVPSLQNITLSKAQMAITLLFMLMKQPYATQVANYYTSGLKDSDEEKLHKALELSFGDYHLTCPTILFGSAVAQINKANKAYAYRMSQKPNVAIRQCEGVCHGDDIIYLFGFPIKLRGIGFTESDYKLSTDMIKAWTSFAKNGTIPQIDSIEWKEAIDKSENNPYVKIIELVPNSYHMEIDKYKSSCEGFWKTLI